MITNCPGILDRLDGTHGYVMKLDEHQIRRLRAGMCDPIDGDHKPMTIRADYVTAMLDMIDARDDALNNIWAALEYGDAGAALKICNGWFRDKYRDDP